MKKITLPNGKKVSFPNDMSDEDINSALVQEFGNDLGSSSNAKGSGVGGMLGDLIESLSNAPGQLKNMAMGLPGQAKEAGSYLLHHPLRGAADIGAGVMEGLKGAANTPFYLAQYLKNKGLSQDFLNSNDPLAQKLRDQLQTKGIDKDALIASFGKAPIPEDTGVQKSLFGETQPGEGFIQALGSFAPYSRIGSVAKGLSGIAKRGAGAAAYSVGQQQDPIVGSLMSIVPDAAIKGVGSLKHIPLSSTDLAAKAFRGRLTPEELADNLRATEGTHTPLGRVLENKALTTAFENITSHVPFAGAEDIMHNLKNEVEGRAEDVVGSMAPKNTTGDLNDVLQKTLKDAMEKQRLEKDSLYDERGRIATEEGHVLKMPKTEAEAKRLANSIENSPLYEADPDFKSQYNKVLKHTKIGKDTPAVISTMFDQNGNLKNPYGDEIIKEASRTAPSLTEAQVIASDWRKTAKELQRSTDAKNKVLGKNLGNIAKAMKQDVTDSIASGSPQLQEAHNAAEKTYKENYSPFLDEDVVENLDKKEPQSIIREIISPNRKADKYREIEKVNALLPEDKKHLMGYSYLEGARDKYGNRNPKEVAALINSLGNRQFEKLYPNPEVRQSLLDYGKLRGMNEKALSRMYNPETGAKNLMALILGALAKMKPIGGGAVVAGSRAANKFLTSPEIRSKIVNKMIEDSKKNSAPKASYSQKPTVLIQALMQAAKAKQPQKEEEK